MLKEVFGQVVLLLADHDPFSLQYLYIDGTGINASGYYFIWGRAIKISKVRIKHQPRPLWEYTESVAREEMENNEPDNIWLSQQTSYCFVS